jgi:ribosomal protein S18 acetylase RimI-like enzyme
MTRRIDLERPSSVERIAFLDAFRAQLGDSETAGLAHLGLSWDELALAFERVGQVRCVRCDGRTAGFVWTERRGRTLHLHAIVLWPEYRGRGIGAEVLRTLEREANGRAETFELGVQVENTRVLAFYERHGFRRADVPTAPGFRILRKPIC